MSLRPPQSSAGADPDPTMPLMSFPHDFLITNILITFPTSPIYHPRPLPHLAIMVVNDGTYPEHICEQCHEGVAATVALIDRMVEGQQALRSILTSKSVGCAEEQQLSKIGFAEPCLNALIDLQGLGSPIPMDDVTAGGDGVKLYGSEHPMSLSVSGGPPKRRRGRPLKTEQKSKPGTAVGVLTELSAARPRRKTVMPSSLDDALDPGPEAPAGLLHNLPVHGGVQCSLMEAMRDVLVFEGVNDKNGLFVRFRDSVAGEAFESLVDGAATTLSADETASTARNSPSIVVSAEEQEAPPADLPFSINIEILEQDGNFILRGIDSLNDLKPMDAGKQLPQRTLLLQPNSMFVDSKQSNGMQQVSQLSSNTFLMDSSDPTSLDLSALKMDDITSQSFGPMDEPLHHSSNDVPASFGYTVVPSSSVNLNYSMIVSSSLGDVMQQRQLSDRPLSDDSHLSQQHEMSAHSHQLLSHRSSMMGQEGHHNEDLPYQAQQMHMHEDQMNSNVHIAQQFPVSHSSQTLPQSIQFCDSQPSMVSPRTSLGCSSNSDVRQIFSNESSSELTNGLLDATPEPEAVIPTEKNSPEVITGDWLPLASGLPKSARIHVAATKKRGVKRRARYKCPICAKMFLREGRYKYHIFLHGSVDVQCLECKQKFNDHKQLSRHQLESKHSGVGIVEMGFPGLKNVDTKLHCRICPNMSFDTVTEYETHQSSVHESSSKRFSCSHCDKKFLYDYSLRSHVTLCHSDDSQDGAGRSGTDRSYPCDACGKVFRHLSSLAYHTDSAHSKGRVFVCSLCGAVFKHKQVLQRHYSVHSSERPHECQVCKKRFKTRVNLLNHAASHSTEKKYSCEICFKQFNYLTSIALHLRSHTGEKPFSCRYCGKKFAQRGNMQEHERIHTGEKPFVCAVCQKRFTTSSQVRHHSRIHERKSAGGDRERKSKSSAGPGVENSNSSGSGGGSGDGATTAVVVLQDSNGGGLLSELCSRCCQPLPPHPAAHLCSSNPHAAPSESSGERQLEQPTEELLSGTQTWLVAGPASQRPAEAGGADITADCSSNFIYILADKDDSAQPLHTDHSCGSLHRGEVELVGTAGPVQQQLTVQAGAAADSWRSSTGDTLQLYAGSHSGDTHGTLSHRPHQASAVFPSLLHQPLDKNWSSSASDACLSRSVGLDAPQELECPTDSDQTAVKVGERERDAGVALLLNSDGLMSQLGN
ncbi:Zinc finger C2H2-type [Trinorchestia longiramus]|nr:Zinc finger C2H2-type [Trinorchestia longiramus]